MKEYTYRIQNIIARFAFVIVLFACAFVLTGCSADKPNQQTEILRLTQWQYHRGDLPRDSTGNYWFPTNGRNDSNWRNTSSSILSSQENKIAWLRTPLPTWQKTAPAVFVNRAEQLISIYLDGKKIFTNRKFISGMDDIDALTFRWYLVPLPENCSGKYLYFRFYSQSEKIGLASQVSLGSTSVFLEQMASENIPDVIIGAFILAAALVMLSIFIFLRREKFYLGLTIFFFSLGTYISLNHPYVNIFFKNTALIYFLDDFALIFSPFFFMVLESTVPLRYQKYFRWIWKIHLVFLITAVILILTTSITMNQLLLPFFILILITSNSSLIPFVKSTSWKKIDSVILLIGTIVFSFLSTVEIILYYVDYFAAAWYTRTYVLQWGTLFFVGALIVLAMYRYLQELKEAKAVQEQLVRQQQLALEANQREIQTREQYTHQLLQSQDNERKRIALELHDAVGQELLIIKNLSTLCIKSLNDPVKNESSTEYIKEISSASASVIESVRTLSKNLHPYQLDNLGLSEALEAVVQRFEGSSEIQFKYSVERIDGLLDREQELHIYRILQELLNNIIKHSGAKHAEVFIGRNENDIVIKVKDNGKGINKAVDGNSIPTLVKGFGISGINERVSILHGTMSLESENNKGASIYIQVPIKGK